MSTVVSPSAFKVSNVTFSPVKTLESGGKQAYLNYNGQPLMMQVGPLETPFGLSVFDKMPGAPPKYSVDLKLRGYDDATNHPKTATIYNAFHALDEFMVDQGVKNSAAWFKGLKSREVLAELYTPTVKFAKDAEGNLKPYPPTLKVQLRKRDGKFETDVYDDKKRLMSDVPLEDIIVKGSVLTTLIQCTGVWFAGGKYGLSWKAVQIRADKVPARMRGPAFLPDESSGSAAAAPQAKNQFAALSDDEEDDVNDEEALASPAPAKVAPASAAAADEEDEEEAAVVEPVAVPKKAVKLVKKVLAKK